MKKIAVITMGVRLNQEKDTQDSAIFVNFLQTQGMKSI